MKTKNLLITILSAIGLAATGAASTADSFQGQAQVEFNEPANFTDAAADSQNTERGRESNLTMLRDHIQKEAARLLAPGQRLVVTVTNVDLAGEFEPWRASELQDVRMVKESSPPLIALSYRLTDARGNVLSEGRRELTNLNFLSTLSINRDEPLRHEKALLTDFLRDLRSHS